MEPSFFWTAFPPQKMPKSFWYSEQVAIVKVFPPLYSFKMLFKLHIWNIAWQLKQFPCFENLLILPSELFAW